MLLLQQTHVPRHERKENWNFIPAWIKSNLTNTKDKKEHWNQKFIISNSYDKSEKYEMIAHSSEKRQVKKIKLSPKRGLNYMVSVQCRGEWCVTNMQNRTDVQLPSLRSDKSTPNGCAPTLSHEAALFKRTLNFTLVNSLDGLHPL